MKNSVIHLPQTDATGLSENWLFKHCGEVHWESLCAAMGVEGVNSEQMRDEAGNRLYPTFVAIQGRYTQPLCTVQMDQVFSTAVKLKHFGRAFFQSLVTFQNEAARFDLEMLTTFVARNKAGFNQLHQALPANHLEYTSEPLTEAPQLLKLTQALRQAAVSRHEFFGKQFSTDGSGLDLSITYQPSPYTDYNGAGLLYFAAYPAITDSLERALIGAHHLAETDRDWAWQTSTIARDVFYYRNLDPGGKLTATLKCFDRDDQTFMLHTQLTVTESNSRLADVFTAKRILN